MGDDTIINKSITKVARSAVQQATKKSEEIMPKHGTRKVFANTKNRNFEKSVETKKRKVGKPNPAIWKKKQAEILQRKGIDPTKSTADIDEFDPKRDPDPLLWAKVGSGLRVEVTKDSDEVSVLTEYSDEREGFDKPERDIDEFECDDEISVDAERKICISGVSVDVTEASDILEC